PAARPAYPGSCLAEQTYDRMACPAPPSRFPSYAGLPATRGLGDMRWRAARERHRLSSSPVEFPPEAQDESRLREAHRVEVVDGLDLVGEGTGGADLPPSTDEQEPCRHRRELGEITSPSARQIGERREHCAVLALRREVRGCGRIKARQR